MEFANADFGDERLTGRLEFTANQMAANPSQSFPKALASQAAREGAYRFLSNETVNPDAILQPHIAETLKRVMEEPEVLAVHDTTDFEFRAVEDREGLGWLKYKKKGSQGFFGHFSLALSLNRIPLGVLRLETIFRQGKPKGKRSPATLRKDSNKESLRWGRGVKQCGQQLEGKAKVIHVMDREGDSYALFADMISDASRFVVRLSHDRGLVSSELEPTAKLFEVMAEALPLLQREVKLTARRGHKCKRTRKVHPTRKARDAPLSISATAVTIQRAGHTDSSLPAFIKVNVVRVWEPNPPEGETAIEWKLITTEPIDTVEQVEKIVDIYRARWVVEEYFKALKTGCAYEKRQLESKTTLLNALAVFVPIAWRLLLLRSLGSEANQMPATTALTSTQIQVLRVMSKRKLPESPTVYEAMMAVASLGGHIKNNGSPGWIVLGRGFNDLLLLETGWLAAKGKM
jgi:hypothetical protein